MVWLPIAAAVLYGIALAHYKWTVTTTKVDQKFFLSVHFLMIFLVTIPFALGRGTLDTALFTEPRYLLLLLILVVFGVAHNFFLFRGLKRESLHEYELIDLLIPVFTISLASIAFIDERDPVRLSLAFFATGVFLITHLRHRHFNFKQADRWLVYAVFIMAIERVLIKPLLVLASPTVLYSVRCGLIALVIIALLRPTFSWAKFRQSGQIAVNALLGAVATILVWFSIDSFGIVVTELYLLIAPMILAVISVIFFKERWNAREGMAFVVIILCIVLVNILPK